ncbi:hypothetical protein BJY24_004117 [Nocardia transvalensis]|uniref:Uncharacterized protein n=1 Tax=Nocardia transvalensis TaxID=37333 RepID=A0A7W9PG29_9NOCA|nr:hypothetical protein [Nocardia transvalensis]MBB5915250.1 hypothetical protein [Nocardia transvalensis]
MTTTKRTCRSTDTDERGLRWDCDRRTKHTGNHQTHYPGSRVVLRSWHRNGAAR